MNVSSGERGAGKGAEALIPASAHRGRPGASAPSATLPSCLTAIEHRPVAEGEKSGRDKNALAARDGDGSSHVGLGAGPRPEMAGVT